MTTFEEVFGEKLCPVLVACAEARAAIPVDWNKDLRKQYSRRIATAMGLLQPPGAVFSVFWAPHTYSWAAVVHDMDVGKPADYERRVQDLAARVSGYALLGGEIVKHLGRLLDTCEVRQCPVEFPPDVRERLASAGRCFRAIVDAVGDEGVYPWL